MRLWNDLGTDSSGGFRKTMTDAMPSFNSSHALRAVRLTKREVEILGLIAQGHSSQGVADLVFLSKRTVDFHLANVYEKLGVKNRVQAFRAATRLGLIPHEPTMGYVLAD